MIENSFDFMLHLMMTGKHEENLLPLDPDQNKLFSDSLLHPFRAGCGLVLRKHNLFKLMQLGSSFNLKLVNFSLTQGIV